MPEPAGIGLEEIQHQFAEAKIQGRGVCRLCLGTPGQLHAQAGMQGHELVRGLAD